MKQRKDDAYATQSLEMSRWTRRRCGLASIDKEHSIVVGIEVEKNSRNNVSPEPSANQALGTLAQRT